MRFSIAAIATAILAIGADARIEGIAVPPSIQVGQGFNLKLLGHNYIQSVDEIAAVVGVTPQNFPGGAIGPTLGSYYLGPEQSNTIGNITKWVPVPATQSTGPARINVQLYQLYGASRVGVITNFGVNVNFVNTPTSNTYILGDVGTNGCSA
jgi:hypothetical protein